MLNFTQERRISAEPNRPPEGKASLSGGDLATLTKLVISRFLSQVKWEDIVEIYLAGLVDDEDLALIKRAVRAIADEALS